METIKSLALAEEPVALTESDWEYVTGGGVLNGSQNQAIGSQNVGNVEGDATQKD
jgi:hypothetical protein